MLFTGGGTIKWKDGTTSEGGLRQGKKYAVVSKDWFANQRRVCSFCEIADCFRASASAPADMPWRQCLRIARGGD